MITCKYCGKKCSKHGIKNHISIVHEKKRKMPSQAGRVPWNKGLTKDTNDIVKKYAEHVSISLKGKSTGKASTLQKELQRKKNISETLKKNPNAGGYRHGSGRGIHTWYESPIAGRVYLDSSYELAYAKFLDINNTKWKKNLIKFPYIWENKIRHYLPDFYLVDDNTYVETKGYKTEKDDAKWKQFPHKLQVLMGEDLNKLGLNVVV